MCSFPEILFSIKFDVCQKYVIGIDCWASMIITRNNVKIPKIHVKRPRVSVKTPFWHKVGEISRFSSPSSPLFASLSAWQQASPKEDPNKNIPIIVTR